MSVLELQAANKPHELSASWYEASARNRIRLLLDAGSFREFIGPEQREISPHLPVFNLPEQFDDGIIVGRGSIAGAPVFLAAQEGRFMGGAFGEVAEIMRAVIEARMAGVKVVGLIGGRAGCYGGGGLIAGCCSALAISEQGRIAVSGPEVIETNRGVEEFDSRDRALVWRTMGGKHRRLLGGADAFVDDTVQSFRDIAVSLIAATPAFSLDVLKAEQTRLEERLQRFGACADALDIWSAEGVSEAEAVPALPADQFIALADKVRRPRHDAR
jgi:malonate decarboxylase beta subunit